MMKWVLKNVIVIAVLCAVLYKITGVDVGRELIRMTEGFITSVDPVELAMTLKELCTKLVKVLFELTLLINS